MGEDTPPWSTAPLESRARVAHDAARSWSARDCWWPRGHVARIASKKPSSKGWAALGLCK